MKLVNLEHYLSGFPHQPYALKVWAEAAQSVCHGESLQSLSFIDILDLSRRAIRSYPAEARAIGMGGLAILAEWVATYGSDAQAVRNAVGILEDTVAYVEKGERACAR